MRNVAECKSCWIDLPGDGFDVGVGVGAGVGIFVYIIQLVSYAHVIPIVFHRLAAGQACYMGYVGTLEGYRECYVGVLAG